MNFVLITNILVDDIHFCWCYPHFYSYMSQRHLHFGGYPSRSWNVLDIWCIDSVLFVGILHNLYILIPPHSLLCPPCVSPVELQFFPSHLPPSVISSCENLLLSASRQKMAIDVLTVPHGFYPMLVSRPSITIK